jgi:phosphate transport system ATP-binding protein
VESLEVCRIETRALSVYYGNKRALQKVTMRIPVNRITALIGPSGCGKTTFLRAVNRLNELVEGVRTEGTVLLDGTDIYGKRVDVTALRRRVGMIFQKSNPFPMSVYNNVAYGPRLNGVRRKEHLDELVERSLRNAALWDEVKDRLRAGALSLSGGQQQRLCIARALAVDPEVLLMDEPSGALDPTTTARIEDLLVDLKEQYTIVIVTHNLQQAARVSDMTAFLYGGVLIEHDNTRVVFTSPRRRETEEYITGRFG